LEFYSIAENFNNNLFSENWSEELKEKYIKISKELLKMTIFFLDGIENNSLVANIKKIEFHYVDIFWNF
jgi:hypothetical protein